MSVSDMGLLFQDSDDQLFSPTVEEDIAFGPLNLGKSRGEVRTIVPETKKDSYSSLPKHVSCFAIRNSNN